MFSLKINKKSALENRVCLLWKALTAWFPASRLKMMSYFVSAHGSHCAQIWLKGVDIKIPPLFYLVCLRSFGALSGRTYPQYRLCDLFMIMEYSCDDVRNHE